MRSSRQKGVGLVMILLGAMTPALAQDQQAVVPLPRAHAHNDYRHPQPLIDALARGFCSVEADVFLVDGQLLVGHDRDELQRGRTLQKLYLDPLRERAARNGGKIYDPGPPLTLLIDIKADGKQVYANLHRVLASYDQIISRVEAGRYIERAVQVVISGDRPIDEIAAHRTRYVGIDGRLSDLDSELPEHLMPLISDRWTSHFRWRGRGTFPAEEKAKLRSIVDQAHAAGRRVRFWATPEQPALWRELLAADVDHINTDQLDRLREFLLDQRQ